MHPNMRDLSRTKRQVPTDRLDWLSHGAELGKVAKTLATIEHLNRFIRVARAHGGF
jgi:hypothetical protein